MQEVKFTYQENELDCLMNLEEEVMGNIIHYCTTTGKEVNSTLFVSYTLPLIYTLEITVTQR